MGTRPSQVELLANHKRFLEEAEANGYQTASDYFDALVEASKKEKEKNARPDPPQWGTFPDGSAKRLY